MSTDSMITRSTAFPGTLAQPVTYPICQRGEPQGYGHEFVAGKGEDESGAEKPLLYCRLCGQVRRFRLDP